MKFSDIFKQITFKTINRVILLRQNKITLDKNNNYNNMKIIFSPALILADNKKDIKTLSEKIKNFLVVMDKECKNFNSTLFIKNIKKTLFNIRNLREYLIEGKNGSVIFDEPILFKIDSFKVINHEFMHLSSIERKILENPAVEVLKCFNEGYTQLLTERYFKDSEHSSYFFEIIIVSHIEQVLGRDYMETEFFKGNFFNLFNELYKYTDSQNMNYLISNANRLFQLSRNVNDLINNITEEKYLLKEIMKSILICFKNKLKNMDNYEEKVKYFMNSNWCQSVSLNINETKYDFNVIDEETYNQMIDELFNEYLMQNKRN